MTPWPSFIAREEQRHSMNSSVCILKIGAFGNPPEIGVRGTIQGGSSVSDRDSRGGEYALALVLFCFGQLERSSCHRDHPIKVVSCPAAS